jgi:hypothetical protein
MSGGVPAGATTSSQPSTSKPGSVSPIVGRSSTPGKRCAELIAIRRTLPSRAKPTTAANELIIACVVPAAVSCSIWPVARYGTSTMPMPPRLFRSRPTTTP